MYDQYGAYFRAVWDHKPNQTEVIQALVDLNKPTEWTRERYLAEQHMEQFTADADHILTGGGRRGVEDSWYTLTQEPSRKLWGHK